MTSPRAVPAPPASPREGTPDGDGTPDGIAPDRTRVALDRATEAVRASSGRMTGPRRAVLAALAGRPEHLTADQVVVAVAQHDPSVHRASVYRTLETLSELGVVQHVHVGHGTTTYHLADDHPHLHAQCGRCGQVIDLPGDLLDVVRRQVGVDYGFDLDPTHVALSGVCSSCRTEP